MQYFKAKNCKVTNLSLLFYLISFQSPFPGKDPITRNWNLVQF